MKSKSIDKTVLQKAFSLLCTAKSITETFEEQFKLVSKYVHATSRGHEAIQIAVGMQLTPKDYVAPYYRDDAMLLSIGMQPYDLMLQRLLPLLSLHLQMNKPPLRHLLVQVQLSLCIGYPLQRLSLGLPAYL